MTEREHSRAGLLMLELIVALLFFAIAAAGCLQVFARAGVTSRSADQLKLALNSTENLIQQLKASDGSMDSLSQSYPQMDPEQGVIYFDASGNSCGLDAWDYRVAVKLTAEENGSTVQVAIGCFDVNGGEIYSISTVLVAGG